jgi:hypothetical protein
VAAAGAIVVLTTALWLVAVPVGTLLTHRLNERMGIDGLVPPTCAVICAGIVAFAGHGLAAIGHADPSWLTRLALPAMAAQTALVVVWRTLINPPD